MAGSTEEAEQIGLEHCFTRIKGGGGGGGGEFHNDAKKAQFVEKARTDLCSCLRAHTERADTAISANVAALFLTH